MSLQEESISGLPPKKEAKVVTFKLISILLLLISTLLLFGWLTHEVVLEEGKTFDAAILNFIDPFNTESTRMIMKFFTFLGSTAFLLPVYALIIALLLKKKKKVYAINVAIMAVSSFLLVKGLKLVFQRARPEKAFIEQLKNYSFPSGHSVSAFVFFSIVIYIVWKLNISSRLKILFTIILFTTALLVGLSRIMLGAHYPSDVVAGFSLGCAWVIISNYILKWVNPYKE